MRYSQVKNSFGLDAGQSNVRIVSLLRNGKSLRIGDCATLDIAKEGILDDTELFSDGVLGKWLRDRKLAGREYCVGIPQYLCSTRAVNDFPVTNTEEQLKGMVTAETIQLAKLSEESFISDYCRMTPAYGVVNPVLIGFCRETVAEDYAARCDKAGILLSDFAMGGMALANAFFYLKPERAKADKLQLLLDIGTENSTLVLLCGGNVLYTGCLMFGARRFTQILAHQNNSSEADAERAKIGFAPDWDNPASPFLFAARQLQTELRTSLDNWRSGEVQQLADRCVEEIWLSGGGSKTIGLPQYLERVYGCPVTVFGPEVNGAADPAFVVAFGLALQPMCAAYPISLATSGLRWYKDKLARFRYLMLAAMLFFFTLLVSGIFSYTWLDTRLKEINEGMDGLRQCNKLVPQLEAAIEQIEYQQKLLVPLVEQGGRSKVFMRTFSELCKAFGPKDWCFYFADEFSYKAANAPKVEEAPVPVTGGMDLFGNVQVKAKPEPKDENRINLQNVPLLSRMVVGGFTPVESNKKYAGIVQLQAKLRGCGYFSGEVDTLVEEWAGQGLSSINGWMQYLRSQRSLLGEYADFKLVLPLAKKQVDIPAAPVKKTKGKK